MLGSGEKTGAHKAECATTYDAGAMRLYLFVYVPGIEWPGWLQGSLRRNPVV